MKLLTAGPTPFGAKVRMAIALAGLEIEAQDVDAHNQAPELVAANPLGKIPCLVLDDGFSVFDSRVITRYLHNRFETRLYPAENSAEALRVSRFEALCDGICDSAVGHAYERRMRPQEKVHQPWLDRLWTKVVNGLEFATGELPPLGDAADIRTCCFGATLGYLALRFEGKWEAGNPAAIEWLAAFDEKNPALSALKPKA